MCGGWAVSRREEGPRDRILLLGPRPVALSGGSYGGGTGGYTRNMAAYLNHYRSDRFQQIPCFHTIRGGEGPRNRGLRLLVDASRLARAFVTHRPAGLHIMAQYRGATPREYAAVQMARSAGIPVLYEIKAGAFATWYPSTGFANRRMVDAIVRLSRVVLGEGQPTVSFVEQTLGHDCAYFPNYVPSTEIPAKPHALLHGSEVRVLFVGYCYRSKGVFELVEGCRAAAAAGRSIRLDLVGQEHPDFTAWLDGLPEQAGMRTHRHGRVDHDAVLERFSACDVYCYPTSHAGEGHNNTINEAMMMGVVVLTTRHGFIPSALGEGNGYFLDDVSGASVAACLAQIDQNREEARQRAASAHARLRQLFHSDAAHERLERHYRRLVDGAASPTA